VRCPLLAQTGHRLLHCTCLLLTQSGHGAAIGTYVKLSIAVNRPRTTCDDAVEADSVKEQRTTRPKARKAPTTHGSGADFLAIIVIEDKGNGFFKDLNLGVRW
jgi:hypothetical protein